MSRTKPTTSRRSKSSHDRDSIGSSRSGALNNESNIDRSIVEALKHMDTFYQAPPPGLIKESEDPRPEDAIPDLPQNKSAREFLAKAPSKGLWMPLGKEVKVMQCWKCKSYGHRSGDKECPLFYSGNRDMEKFRYMHEDPMHAFVEQRKAEKKEERIKQLQSLLDAPTSESEDETNKPKKEKKKTKKSKHGKDKKRKREQRSNEKEKRHRDRRKKSRSRSRSRD